jgi:hypothetical protein
VGQHYTAQSGQTVAGGLYLKPAWLRARTIGVAEEIPGTAMSLSPALFDWGGNPPGMQSGIINAWGCVVIDPITLRAYFRGGAHGDYGGNEWMAQNLLDDILSYQLECAPTPMSQMVRYVNGGYPNYSHWNEDGKPTAAHMYGAAGIAMGKIFHTHYFSDFGKTLAGYLPFAPANEAWLPAYDLAMRQYDAPNTHGLMPNSAGGGGIGSGPFCSDGRYCYAVIINDQLGAYYLHRYGPLTKIWSPIGAPLPPPDWDSGTYPIPFYDSIRHALVQIGEKSKKIIRRYDLNTGVKTEIQRTGVDFGGSWDSSYTCFHHDTKRDIYRGYSGQANTDKNFYEINPDTGLTSIRPGTGTPAIDTVGSGMNNRFPYIERLDCALGWPAFDKNMICLRLS